MNTEFKNLAFEGGGVKGIAYAGAIKVLEDYAILKNIEKVAGTSAGAITAALICLGYNASEIYAIVKNTDFATFEDGWDPLRIVTKYGIYKGDAFLSWIKKAIKGMRLDENITFKGLQVAGKRDLHVFASDLNTKNLKEFSVDLTPDVIVAEAVRASMSIPLFFAAWQFSNNQPDNHIYVDGGVVYNYPLTAFDTKAIPNYATLGFHLDNLSAPPVVSDLKYDELKKYIINLFDTLMDTQIIDMERDPSMLKRTVRIDDFGISGTNFNISPQQEEELYNSGIKCTTDYLNKIKQIS